MVELSRRKHTSVLRRFVAVAAFALASCGGGGGNPDAQQVVKRWGEPDRSYGTEGVARLESMQDSVQFVGPRMALAADGTAYVGRSSELAKVDANGIPAASFGDAGAAQVPARRYSSSPVLDPAGNAHVHTNSGVFKTDAMGRPVLAFGTNGHAEAFGPTEQINRLAGGLSGPLYVLGSALDQSIALAKFDRDGRLVTTFGNAGKRSLDFSGVGDAVLDASGHLFVAGAAESGRMFVAKLDEEGRLAADFGTGGVSFATVCPGERGLPSAIAVDRAGGIFVGGYCFGTLPTDHTAALIKLDSRGNIDSSFSAYGLRRDLFGQGDQGAVARVLPGPDGEVYVAGQRTRVTPSTCHYVAAVVKLDVRGNPVPTAEGNLVVLLEGEGATDLALDALGRLYVGTLKRNACQTHPPVSPTFLIHRLGS